MYQTLALSLSLSRYLSLSVSVRNSICRPVSLMTRSLLLSLVPSFFSTSSLARMRALVCACVFFCGQSLWRSTLSCFLTRSLFLLDPQAQTRRPLAICLHEFHFKQAEAHFFQEKIILSRKKTVCSKNISFCQKKICLLKDYIVFSKWTFSK